jgi:coenzyme PQQ biosynthesis protein PqqD
VAGALAAPPLAAGALGLASRTGRVTVAAVSFQLVTASRIPRQVPGFSLQALDNELLLYQPGLTKTVHLNQTASLIWQLCDGQRSVDDIVALLEDSFPDDSARIAADVAAALKGLQRDGAIEFV